MLKKILASLALFCLSACVFAMNSLPSFEFLPNIKGTNAAFQAQATELVKKTLNITSESPYSSVRIRVIYNNQNAAQALIVYLLSSQYKSFELVKIALNPDFTVAAVTQNYKLKSADLAQAPQYAHKYTPTCPDNSVQFVIGNNFKGDRSVAKEVMKVYLGALIRGYKPVFMDINNAAGPQPTIEAYENWLSCPNVKGFYNESHGSREEILLSDGDFLYSIVDKDLVNKLAHEVVLFDSCDTFNDPLLSSMINKDQGNSQQYVAGIVPLPFGASERTASCIWDAGFKHYPLTQLLIQYCASKNGLDLNSFRIGGNGDKRLHSAN